MRRVQRRSFLKVAAGPLAISAIGQPQASAQSSSPQPVILLFGDGVSLLPAQYVSVISAAIPNQSFRGDAYLKGAPVDELERLLAAQLGKDRALFLPTGTLANHLAVRVLAGDTRKAIVQAESHLYRDEGDCAQLLSGINLVPLGVGRATLTLDEVTQAVEQAAGPPYPAPVGAISIESPVRRCDGKVFDFEEMKRVCMYARAKGIGTHMDGARMFLASPYTGVSPAQYSALFDTVYVSLYKYFNAPFGAILAGPAPLMSKVEQLRHQFGSLIRQGWESAAVALHYLDGFSERFQNAVRSGEKLFQLLQASGTFLIERVPSGTNIGKLRLAGGGTLDKIRERLASQSIYLAGAQGATEVDLQINETMNRRPAEEIASAFLAAV
jgi:threonine aldolase